MKETLLFKKNRATDVVTNLYGDGLSAACDVFAQDTFGRLALPVPHDLVDGHSELKRLVL